VNVFFSGVDEFGQAGSGMCLYRVYNCPISQQDIFFFPKTEEDMREQSFHRNRAI
jgi:hypothetical protein